MQKALEGSSLLTQQQPESEEVHIMRDTFGNSSNDGEQNIGQGKGAVGKQLNIFMQPLNLKTLTIASVLLTVLAGTAGYLLFAPTETTISTTGNNSPAIIAGGNVVVNQTNNSSVAPEVFAKYVTELEVRDSALASFFKILEEQQVSRGDLDSKLREMAGQYKELLLRLETVQSEDPEVQRLKEAAGQAIEAIDYAKAEELLNRAEARDIQTIEHTDIEEAVKQQQDAARQRRISAVVDNAKLQRMQLRYGVPGDKIFYEDFSAYGEGELPAGWRGGDNLRVVEVNKKKILRYFSNGFYDVTTKNIDLSGDFKATILMKHHFHNKYKKYGPNNNSYGSGYREQRSNSIGIHFADYQVWIGDGEILAGMKDKWTDWQDLETVAPEKIFSFSLDKRGPACRGYVNNTQIVVGRFPDLKMNNIRFVSNSKFEVYSIVVEEL